MNADEHGSEKISARDPVCQSARSFRSAIDAFSPVLIREHQCPSVVKLNLYGLVGFGVRFQPLSHAYDIVR